MVDFDIEYCPHCGYELNYVAGTCPECGAELPEDAGFCPSCGEPIEVGYYSCRRCIEEITVEEVDELYAMSDEERAKHISELNCRFEEDERKKKLAEEEYHKQRDAEYLRTRERLTLQGKEEEELAGNVKGLMTGKVDTIKSVKITPAWIETSFIKDGNSYRMTVPRKSWDVALPRLIDSLDQLPSDVKSYKLERWS